MRLHYKFPAQTCPATKTGLFVDVTIKNSKSATKTSHFVADLLFGRRQGAAFGISMITRGLLRCLGAPCPRGTRA